MKKRLATYALFAILLGISTWYIMFIPSELPVIAVWVITALVITVYEIRQSGKPTLSALAVTGFWLASLTVYTSYWAAIIFLGFGGEQLTQFQIGMSPDWLIVDLQFYRHTMLAYLLNIGSIVLIIGPLLGGGAGWLLIQSSLLQSAA